MNEQENEDQTRMESPWSWWSCLIFILSAEIQYLRWFCSKKSEGNAPRITAPWPHFLHVGQDEQGWQSTWWERMDGIMSIWSSQRRVCRRLIEGCANNQTRGEKYMGHQGSGEEFDTPRNSP